MMVALRILNLMVLVAAGVYFILMIINNGAGLIRHKTRKDTLLELLCEWMLTKLSETPIKIKILEGGMMPELIHDGDAAYDCHARLSEPVTIEPGTVKIIPLGFCLELPKNWYADVRPRSGLTAKDHVVAQLGLIDEPYRKELGGIISNFSDEAFTVNDGDRVCQIQCHEADRYKFVPVKELSETNRGDGFGSSGVRNP